MELTVAVAEMDLFKIGEIDNTPILKTVSELEEDFDTSLTEELLADYLDAMVEGSDLTDIISDIGSEVYGNDFLYTLEFQAYIRIYIGEVSW